MQRNEGVRGLVIRKGKGRSKAWWAVGCRGPAGRRGSVRKEGPVGKRGPVGCRRAVGRRGTVGKKGVVGYRGTAKGRWALERKSVMGVNVGGGEKVDAGAPPKWRSAVGSEA